MNIRIYNLLWNMKMFFRRYGKRVYVDLGAINISPLFFFNDEVISDGR